MDDKALEQVLVDTSIFIDSAIQKISGKGGRIEGMNGALNYLLKHFDKGIGKDWPCRAVKYIKEDIKDIDVLLDKIAAVVALQDALEKICEIDARV